MKSRAGFTLMELLLVVAILAIIAAVAAPQFFRTATQSVSETRQALLRANYQAVKAAINMQLWDQTNNTSVAPLTTTGPLYAGSLARTQTLISNGYLQESAMTYENELGQKRMLLVGLYNDTNNTTTAAPPTGAASAPYYMAKVNLYEVSTWIEAGAANRVFFATPAGTFNSIDAALRAGSTWDQIWEGIRNK